VAFRQFLAEHQAARTLVVVGGELDRKGMHPGLTDDLDRRLAARAGRRDGSEREAGDQRGNKQRDEARQAMAGTDEASR
jgi:hypothetical protein